MKPHIVAQRNGGHKWLYALCVLWLPRDETTLAVDRFMHE